MPRHAREIAESGMYHVIVSCIPGEPLFRDNEDRYAFLERLYEKKIKYQFRILAYTILDEAYHLIIHEHKSNLSTIMKSINVSYSSYMHKKYALSGAIFKDRYKSECLLHMDDVLDCIIHVHLQAVEHHLTDALEQFQWSSYNEYLAEASSQIISKEMVLPLFSLNNTDVKSTFIKRHHIDHRAYLKHEVMLKKHYASLIDAREYIARLLTRHNIRVDKLNDIKYEQERFEIIMDLRNKTALSITDIANELSLKRSQVMQALYSKVHS